MEYGVDENGNTIINGVVSERSVRAHAEICPVCGGSGQLQDYCNVGSAGTNIGYKTCHACQGDGWIVVPNYV